MARVARRRAPFIEGRHRYEIDRYLLTVEARRVELAISVSLRVWQTFTSG